MRRFFVPSPVGRWGCARTLPPFYRRVAPPKIIPVACALILNRDGCVLLAQRPADKHLGLQWEFPGGKVEPGESPVAALIREIDEELGCRIEITGALPPFVHHYATVSIEMHPFVCRLAAATTAPVAHEHAALAWVKPADVRSYDLAAADVPILPALASVITDP